MPLLFKILSKSGVLEKPPNRTFLIASSVRPDLTEAALTRLCATPQTLP
jgi:hypothetical protein